MTQTIDVRGIFCPLPTPFTDGGALDEQALLAHIGFLHAHDVHGLVVLGSTGECAHLTLDEQLHIVRTVREHAPNRILMAGTGRHATRETIDVTRHAAKAGADAALILPPHYYRARMTSDALLGHYTAIADASTIPVVVYNMPLCTGIDLDADTLHQLAQHPNIQGLKDSGGDLSKLARIRQSANDRLPILAGSAGFLLPALSIGCVGGVLALANIAPDECMEIYSLATHGDWRSAQEIQIRLAELNHAVTHRWGIAGLKAAMDLLGLPGGAVRAPLQNISTNEVQELRRLLHNSRLLSPTRRRTTS